MKSAYKLALLVLVSFLVLSYSDDARLFLGHAGNMGMKTPSGSGVPPNNQYMMAANTTAVYYEPTIKNIISADCARCHSGATRNLMDYDSLKMYADAGLLATMVQGPMQRFAGNDAQTIVTWAENGAPEKSAATRVFFRSGNCPPGSQPGAGLPQGQDPITYNNGIRQVLEKDCLRCHSGPFRNLTTYENVKVYVDNGLLKTLVRLGGPMHRFSGPDSRTIIAWVDNGAPQ